MTPITLYPSLVLFIGANQDTPMMRVSVSTIETHRSNNIIGGSMITKEMNFQPTESFIVERRMAAYAVRFHATLRYVVSLTITRILVNRLFFILKQFFWIRTPGWFTFKVAANISYTRDDGQDSNVAGTTFAEIEELLVNLKSRCNFLQTVYIDDCCKLRNKL